MLTRFLRTGALGGAAGGLAAAVWLLVVAERSIGDAIDLEEAGGDELFSRGVQQLGGAVGSVIVGLALGAVFGIVLAAVRHRLPGRTDWHRALWLAAGTYLTVHLVPALKYPPNPPAVGDPDTIGDRTVQYLLLIGVAVVATVAARRLAAWLRERGAGEPLRTMAAVALWAGVVGLAILAFPSSGEPVLLPADLVWRFRLHSLGGTLLHWAVAGAVTGWLLLREELPERRLETRQPVGVGNGDARDAR